MPQVGAHGHKRATRLRLSNSPVTVQELRKARDVVHAHNVGTGLDSAQAHAERGGIALGGLGHARDSAHKALARHGAHERISQRRHLGGLALDDDILVGRLAKARARIDADAVARHAGVDECAGLIGQKAHDAAHDGRRIRQGKAAKLRGGNISLLAAGAAAHHGGQVIAGLRRGLRVRGGLGDRGGLFGSRCLLLLLVRRLGRGLRISKRQRGLHHATRQLGLRLGLAQQLATATAGRLLRLARGLSSCLARLLGNKRRGRGIKLHRRVRTSGSGDLAGVHHDNAAGARLNKLNHLGVGEARHVVDDRGAAAHGRLSNRHVARVNRDDSALFGQRAHHGQHAASLLVGVDRGKTRARGLAAHVDDVGAGVEHRQAVLDGGIRVEVFPAIAKRIGRHVEDAHDARTVKAELVLSAPPCLAIVRHEHPPQMPAPPRSGADGGVALQSVFLLYPRTRARTQTRPRCRKKSAGRHLHPDRWEQDCKWPAYRR